MPKPPLMTRLARTLSDLGRYGPSEHNVVTAPHAKFQNDPTKWTPGTLQVSTGIVDTPDGERHEGVIVRWPDGAVMLFTPNGADALAADIYKCAALARRGAS